MQARLHIVVSSIFLIFLFSFSVLFFILPDNTFSSTENRSLRSVPDFGLEKLFSGVYSSEINDYFADQFPFRDFWVGQKASMELLLGKGENDGILIGHDGVLAKRMFSPLQSNGSHIEDVDTFDPVHVKRSLEGIQRVAQGVKVPFSALLVGRNVDIAGSSFSYPSVFCDLLWSQIAEELGAESLTLDVYVRFKAFYESGEYVYYKTDHHWTTRGAYYAYCAIMKSFGMSDEILSEMNFQKEAVSDSFLGSLHSAAGIRDVTPDVIELWRTTADANYVIKADGRQLDSPYQMKHLNGKDKYSVFLDGTHDVVTIQKESDHIRPRLMIVKDSFANSVVPFLIEHFDIVMLNLSSTKNDFTNVSELARRYQVDRVLLLYSVENMITADKLTRLN